MKNRSTVLVALPTILTTLFFVYIDISTNSYFTRYGNPFTYQSAVFLAAIVFPAGTAGFIGARFLSHRIVYQQPVLQTVFVLIKTSALFALTDFLLYMLFIINMQLNSMGDLILPAASIISGIIFLFFTIITAFWYRRLPG